MSKEFNMTRKRNLSPRKPPEIADTTLKKKGNLNEGKYVKSFEFLKSLVTLSQAVEKKAGVIDRLKRERRNPVCLKFLEDSFAKLSDELNCNSQEELLGNHLQTWVTEFVVVWRRLIVSNMVVQAHTSYGSRSFTKKQNEREYAIETWKKFTTDLAFNPKHFKCIEIPDWLEVITLLVGLFYKEAFRTAILLDGKDPDEVVYYSTGEREDETEPDYGELMSDLPVYRSFEKLAKILICILTFVKGSPAAKRINIEIEIRKLEVCFSPFIALTNLEIAVLWVLSESSLPLSKSGIEAELERIFKDLKEKESRNLTDVLKKLNRTFLCRRFVNKKTTKQGGRSYVILKDWKSQLKEALSNGLIKLPMHQGRSSTPK
jgi:hypothetical protein